MCEVHGHDELVSHLERTTRLERLEAERILDEILAYFSETPQEFVCRRHSELQAESLTNPVIFERIAAELARRRFPSPALSLRQIRRVIYG